MNAIKTGQPWPRDKLHSLNVVEEEKNLLSLAVFQGDC